MRIFPRISRLPLRRWLNRFDFAITTAALTAPLLAFAARAVAAASASPSGGEAGSRAALTRALELCVLSFRPLQAHAPPPRAF